MTRMWGTMKTNKRNFHRTGCAAIVAAAGCLTGGFAAPVWADDAVPAEGVLIAVTQDAGSNAEIAQGNEERSFDIPAQTLASALLLFKQQSGLQLAYKTADVAGLSGREVKGAMSQSRALARLLEGSGLIFEFTAASTVTLARAAADGSKLTLGTISVEGKGESAWGPVNGYVAKRSATATKTDTPLIETPQSISVITADEMAATKPASISQAMGYTPGVMSQAETFSRMVDDVMVRGFNVANGNLGMLRDGMKLQSNVYDGGQEPYGMERLEILKGPASILYGQLGPGGAINAVSKRPTLDPLREINVEYGSYDRKQLSADFGGMINGQKEYSFRLTGLVRDADTWVDYVNDDKRYIAPAFTWAPTEDTTLTVLASYQEVRTKFATPMDFEDLINETLPRDLFIGEPGFDRYDGDTATLGYELTHEFSDSLKVRHSLRRFYSIVDWHYLAYGDLQADNSLTRNVSWRTEKSDGLTMDTNVQVEFGGDDIRHTLVAGTDLYLRSYDRDRHSGSVAALDNIFNPTYGATPTINYGSSIGFRSSSDHLGFYAQDQIKLYDKWVLVLGGRADFVKSELKTSNNDNVTKQSDNAGTGRAGLVYLFDNGLAPYASYSQSFTPQSGADKNGNAFIPTEGEQYEAGLRYQPPNMNLSVTGSVYQLTQTNVLTTDPDDTSYSIQTGEVRSRGAELEAKASLGNFNLIASYAYTDARNTSTNTVANQGERIALVPYHTLGIWADYTFADWGLAGLRLGAGLRYAGSTHITGTNTNVPDVTTVDALMSYDFGAVNKAMEGAVLTVNAQNLLDQNNLTCVSLTGCRYGAPRTVTASLQYSW